VIAFAEWLALREPADAAARAEELIVPLRRRRPAVIHDLGTGTGSMGRWLAPRLPGPQHWVMYDRDADLLVRAAAAMADRAADGAPVTAETRERDVTRLTRSDLAGASLITASALLDMLTADEVERVVTACAGVAPALFTISVVGRVELTPADPLDAEIAAAFNAHQRRRVGGRTLLGPDAVQVTVTAFQRHGVTVRQRPSPWRLGGHQATLVAEWFRGWVGAACEQRPELAGPAAEYARRRLTDAVEGRLTVVVHHTDLLAGCE